MITVALGQKRFRSRTSIKAFKNGKRSGLVDRQQVRIIFFKFLNDEYSCE